MAPQSEHAASLVANDIMVDAIGIGARAGRGAQGLKRLAMSNLWDEPTVAANAGQAQGAATMFVEGAVFTDANVFGSQRSIGPSVPTCTLAHRSNLRSTLAFIEQRTMPPMLTEIMIHRFPRERPGPNKMPA